jgi:hypothetical protein
MSEFKAQILGIILVLGIFVVLNQSVTNFFSDTWNNIQQQVNSLVTTSSETISQ